ASMQYFDEGDLESVTLDVNKNSIGIDLGSTQRVNTLRIRFKDVNDELINYTSGQKAMWSAMIVYVSNDNVNFTNLGSTSRNTVNDGNDVIMSFDFSGVEARYVKINYQHTKTENGLLTALAENASVSATRRITRQWAMAGDVIYMANDIAPTSSSLNEVNDATAPITLKKNSSVGMNFGLVSDVEAVELIGNGTQSLDASDFAVYYSVDNVSYAKINVTSVSRDTRNGQPVLRFNFDNIKATHIKINAVSDVSVSLESARGGVAAYSSVEASSSTTYLTHVAGRGAEGGFFTCDDGTLVMCHIEYDSETHGDEAPAHISIRRSTDGGVTWTKSETFLTKLDETSLNVFVPTFVKLNDGKVGMVFMEKFASGASSVYIITSDDEGKTWSERRKIAYTDGNIGYFCLSSGSPAYKAPNGRILVSFAYSVYENEAYGSDRCYGYVVYSDDNGETWIRSKNSFTVPEGVMEPAMSATPDGKLIMTMTTRKIGLIYRSISEDNGETWSQPVPLQEGFCTSHLTQGHVLIPGTDKMVYICVNDLAVQNGSKTPLISAITADNGASYHNIRHITEGVGAGSSWPVVKIYGRKVIIQHGFNTITVRAFDIAELFHSVTGDISTLPKAATPTAVYNEDTGTLSGLNADIAFSLDGGKTWSYAGGSEVVFEQSHIAKARKILV
ncbi:MAG: exo-alpha-sialidase, partial [Clostridia bacterium]|nr:exo-alpha-sialidase [Clostridia bacterium]